MATNKFLGFLESVGKGFLKGLGWAVAEAPAVNSLAAVLFPPAEAILLPVTAGLTLLQSSIVSIEQKYAASGVQNGTGAQKSAEVLTLAGPAVIQLLAAAGVKDVNSDYVTSLINAIVAILNVHPPVAA